MSREIKFRAWDGRMIICNPIVSDGTDGGETSRVMLNEAIDCFYYILMQYTGLKDKNGKEIYEGDILKDENKEIKQGKSFSIVKWSKYHACFIMERYNGEIKLFVPGCTNSKEIIGNIHSNPELLES